MNQAIRALFICFLLICAAMSHAQIVVSDAVIKEPIPGQSVSAGYFSMENSGEGLKKLVAVSSKSATRVEMHTHVHEGGMMSMKRMEFVLIPAKEVIEFAPGANHLMIFSLDDSAINSGVVDLIFEFEDGESLPVQASLEKWN